MVMSKEEEWVTIVGDNDFYEEQVNLSTTSTLAHDRFRYRIKSGPIESPRPWWNGRAPSDPYENTTRVDVELGFTYGKNHPDYFVDSMIMFQKTYPVEHWKHYVDFTRVGFVKLIAVRRTTEYDTNKDYLREIGF